MNRDKYRLVLTAIGTILLLTSIVLFGYFANLNGRFTSGTITLMIVPILIIFFVAFFLTRRYKDIKQGLPFEDERSKKVINRAAAVSFYISLYWLLAISWFESLITEIFHLEKLEVGQAIGAGIAGMSLIFFVSWMYYDRKGEPS